ncbi:cytidylate kinase-like family protein [Desulfopila inferna]|uniref:cytidylate kinase-like family protein n=1 Tax=Desulfopila inferna TaxID=468528 RepID=UPI00196341C8|nr:cytidylate kinase family protein [Desulfopila inferna]
MDEYLRHLISTVYTLADDGPTIFIGRGTHLILPRERVLAIRIISSRKQRIRRTAELLEISSGSAEKKIAAEDRVQTDFFKANFRKTSAPPTEFDLIINRDSFSRATWAADIIVEAYKLKFGGW